MVAQFEKEGRGPKWVSNGKLLTRQTETYGPNFPGHVPHHGGHMYTCENITLKVRLPHCSSQSDLTRLH